MEQILNVTIFAFLMLNMNLIFQLRGIHVLLLRGS